MGDILHGFMTLFQRWSAGFRDVRQARRNAARVSQLEMQLSELRQTEQSLRTEHNYLQLAMKAARLDTWTWDRKQDVFTYPKSDPVVAAQFPHSFTEFLQRVPAKDHEQINKVIALSLSEAAPYEVEFQYRLPNGRDTWYYSTGQVFHNESGEVAGLVGVALDITKLKKAEESLRKGEAAAHAFQEKLRALHEVSVDLARTATLDEFYFKSIDFGVKRLGFDRLGLFLVDENNPTRAIGTYGTDRYGETRNEFKNGFDLDQNSLINDAMSNRWNIAIYHDHDLWEGDELIGRGWNVLAMLWDRSKPIGWLASDNILRHEPLTDETLELLSHYSAMLGVLLLQKQAELETRRHQERLRLSLQASKMRVWQWKRETDELTYDENLLNGERPIYVSLQALLASVLAEDRARLQELLERCVMEGVPAHEEYRIMLPDGLQHWLFSLGQPFRDDSGEIAGIIGVTQDITERKLAEEQSLELTLQKERVNLLTEFMGNVSHDLKTPLTVLNTSLYLLEHLEDPEERAKKIEVIRLQAALLEQFIQDILTISRLDYAPALEMSPVDWNDLVRDVQTRLQPAAEQHHLSISLNLDSDIPPVLGDASELNRLLINLVENAVHYTPDNGTVAIRTRVQNDDVITEVSDTGIGIHETEIPMIFGRFYRAETARKTRQNGTGLGLAIVQRIVEIHHGQIEVESQVGRGSTFRLHLPVPRSANPV